MNTIITNQPYLEKLKDPRWQKKRLEIFERDNWTCQECHHTDRPLHVHHKLYIKDCEPWDCPNYLLITLCEDCHSFETKTSAACITELIEAISRCGLLNDIGLLSYGLNEVKERPDSREILQMLGTIVIDGQLLNRAMQMHYKYWHDVVKDFGKRIKKRKCQENE
jgi:hypothetical protein